ncbi:UNVERIFIED_CONTAM: hypothetical protein NCL1_29146 [Trichonephila clavipes]
MFTDCILIYLKEYWRVAPISKDDDDCTMSNELSCDLDVPDPVLFFLNEICFIYDTGINIIYGKNIFKFSLEEHPSQTDTLGISYMPHNHTIDAVSFLHHENLPTWARNSKTMHFSSEEQKEKCSVSLMIS